jgi:hypothetical protein
MLAEILEPIMGSLTLADLENVGVRRRAHRACSPPVGSSRGHGQHVRTQRIIDKFALNSVRFLPKNWADRDAHHRSAQCIVRGQAGYIAMRTHHFSDRNPSPGNH